MNHAIEESDHLGWVAPGQLEPTIDFDHAEVLERLGEIEDLPIEAQVQAASVLAKLFVWVWSGNGSLQSALVRHSALFLGLRPDLVDRTYKDVAKECGGLTKQAVGKSILKVEKLLRMKWSRTRPQDARRHMAEARLRNPVSRRGKKQK